MQAAVSLLLLSALMVVTESAELQLLSARQATRSCNPNTETCVLLAYCPRIQNLLRPPTREGILQLQRLQCGMQGSRAKVCCPSSRPDSPAEEPHAPQLTTPNTVPRSGEALLPDLCGIQAPLDKIFLGTTTHWGEHPWMAVLGFQGNRRSDPILWGCGGSLINSRYVLTAAHCTDRVYTNSMDIKIIRLGDYNLDTEDDCNGCKLTVQDFTPEEVVRHPDYNTRGVISDDVALIRLDRPVVPAPGFIGPVCLPALGETFLSIVEDKNPVVIGFAENESGQRTAWLQNVHLSFMASEDCRAIPFYNTSLATGEGQVCLGLQTQEDICLHHPGAPVTVVRTPYGGNPFVQVAIASFAPVVCKDDAPGVYTDVTLYRGWIVDNLKP